MARSLNQIIKELDPGYAGSRKTIQAQQSALPGQTAQQLEGLQAQAEQSHEDILGGARRRGLGFSGIPIGEQVKYDSTVFKPAVADLYSQQNQRATSLDEALNQLFRDQRNQAAGLRQSELDRDLQTRQFQEQVRQFNENLAFQREEAKRQAAQAAALGGYFSGGVGATASTPKVGAATIKRTSNGGFNFFDSAGRPINAAQYSKLSGVGYRLLLSQMAKAGDKNAQIALKYVGNDAKFGSAPSKYAGALSALGASGNYASGIPAVSAPSRSSLIMTYGNAGLVR